MYISHSCRYCQLPYLAFKLAGNHRTGPMDYHEIWGIQIIVKMGNHFALYRPGCKHLNLQIGFTLSEKGFEVLAVKAGGWWNPIMISPKYCSKRERKKTPQWIIWPISQTIHFVKTPQTKLHKMVTCQGRKCGKKTWSFTTQPLFPGHPNPILRKGSRTQFSFEETIIVFLQQQTTATVQQSTPSSLPHVCAQT